MLIEKNLTHSGDRLRRARILAGISTRREFEKKYHISANTLQGWEQGKNPLSKKGAKRVIEALKSEGLICAMEWLMDGKGMPPRPFEMLNPRITSNQASGEPLTDINLDEETAIYQELQIFKSHNPNPIIITISDDSMQPQFHPGDYIGGTRLCTPEAIAPYFGQACIVELSDHTILPRYIHPGTKSNTYTLSCTNHQSRMGPLNIFDTTIISAAPILWHRRKLSSLKAI